MRAKITIDRSAAMERIERVRQASELSKRKFAGSLGMLASNYSRCLRGDVFLTADQLFAIWQLYGADPAFIMAGREDGMTAALRDRLRSVPREGR